MNKAVKCSLLILICAFLTGCFAISRELCGLDSGFHCYRAGEYHNEQQQFFDEAARYYQKACLLRYTRACLQLAMLYENAWMENKNLDDREKIGNAAVDYYVRACDGGIAEGCRRASQRYQQGEMVRANQLRAANFAKKACVLEVAPQDCPHPLPN